jgi:hypothetical protein
MTDDFFSNLILRPDSCDIRPWLEMAHAGHPVTLGELESEASVAILEQLFALNPTRIIAVDPESDGEYTTTNALVIDLPTSSSARREFFRNEAEHAIATGFDPEPDTGQRYLLMKW